MYVQVNRYSNARRALADLAFPSILHLRRKAYATSSELMRQHSILVREDLRTRDESQPPPTPLHYQRSSRDPWTHR